MKGFSEIKYVYLIGIGGIGMSGLARYFNRLGKSVSGYDRTSSSLTEELEKEGIRVHYEDNVSSIPTTVASADPKELLLIYTPAIPKDHKELNHFISKGYKPQKRSQVLGAITEGTFTIAVAGTHGKTTTSTLIAHILKHSGIDITAFLGGISANYNTNFLLGDKSECVVVEADEYDRSFLTLHPDIAVLTSVDPDHLDIYGSADSVRSSYQEFAMKVKEGGKLILNKKIADKISARGITYTYSASENADWFASKKEPGRFNTKVELTDSKGATVYAEVGIPGTHNVENAVAAFAAARIFGLDNAQITSALKSFKGVKRRFEYHVKTDKAVFIDDYAHHPEELRVFINSTKKIFEGKKVTGIFQPHLFTRTRDFADGFAEVLDLLDEAILLDIYPARELPIEGVTSSMLLEKMKSKNKKLLSREQLLDYVKENHFDVLLTMGAGDIELLVDPIKEILEEKVK